MLEVSELADLTDQLLEAHRDTFDIDRFFTIKIEIQEMEQTSECISDEKSVDSWILRLDPRKHADVFDVQYSVVDALLRIMFEKYEKKSVIARLTTSVCSIFEDEAEEYEEEDDEG